ncbi:hypothetical protein QMA40_30190 (plasmid) [Bacillus thuringiensis]|uniref:hypothetical protein n=1 Tax=Bacillus thuringiensis TaxID=1428 RepID=UPI0015C508FB|nr:hypothetical protein [Bacillus thuringiensis]
MFRKKLTNYDFLSSQQLSTTTWPVVEVTNLVTEHQSVFLQRKKAIDLYFNTNLPVKEITLQTSIKKKDLYLFIDRCLQLDTYGIVQGYRGLIPHKNIKPYKRSTLPTHSTQKATGAFTLLLEKYPKITDTINNLYLKRKTKNLQEPMVNIKTIHKKFIDACRNEGISLHEYPFTSKDLAKRSLERYLKKLHCQFFSKASQRFGKSTFRTASNTGIGEKNNHSLIEPFQRVQFDAHRIDAIISITFTTLEGNAITEIMNRIWLLVIMDEATRLVLGHYLCLNSEYSAPDVLKCIKNSVVPKEEYEFTIPGLRYPEQGGYHSLCIKESQWALWDEFLYDNAKANLASIVSDRLTHIVKCSINAGPVDMPERRGMIERFFRTLEENSYHRLPNTTGSSPNDHRRSDAEKQAIKFQITEKEIEELTDVVIAQYNGTPHSALENLSPLEYLKLKMSNGCFLRSMSEEDRNNIVFFTKKETRTISGSVKRGRRPYIQYEDVIYRNEILERSPQLIGTKLTLLVNIDDLRSLNAFLPDGSELGYLKATGKWALQKHSLKVRKAINKLKRNKLIYFTTQDDPIEVFYKYLEEKSKSNKKVRNQLATLQREKRITQNSTKKENIPETNLKSEPNPQVKRRFTQTIIY